MRLNPLHVALGQPNKSNRLHRILILDQLDIVGSKIHDDADSDFVESISPELDIIGYLPVDERVIEAERSGIAIFKLFP